MRLKYWIVTLVVLYLTYGSCVIFIKDGYTIPDGDINLELGNGEIDITCIITNKTMIKERIQNPNSDFIFTMGKERINETEIIRLNETAIQYVNKTPGRMETYISCTYNKHGIGLNRVTVGTKPPIIEDFDCFGYNLENMTCKWTKDNGSVYSVNYTLSYYFLSPDLSTTCANIKEEDKELSCFWNTSMPPYYRTAHEFIYFNLTSKNALGTNYQNFTIDHYKKVKTSPPHNLKVENYTTSSLMLSWEIPESMVQSNVYLNHRIMYTHLESDFDDFILAGFLNTTCKSKIIYYNLTDLPFAYLLYDVRVGMKLDKADEGDMWSANATLTKYTAPTLPGAPYATNAFHNSGDQIIIYWKPVGRSYQNGQGFKYLVQMENGSITTAHNSYLELRNLDTLRSHKFIIYSENEVGMSLNYSQIVIPPLRNELMRMDVPVLKEYDAITYELSWTSPIYGAEHLENYTIYWCESLKVNSLLCSNMNWVIVDKNIHTYNVTISNNSNINMAISANSKNESTSMVWAECIVGYDQPLKNLELNVVDVTATTITVSWKGNCRGKIMSIKQYEIEYCTMDYAQNYCQGQIASTIVNGSYSIATIKDLEPYTTYRIQVLLFDVKGSSYNASKVVYHTTSEGTPGTPENLRIINVTNDSIEFEWTIPNKRNSKVIRYFKIKYNNSTDTISRTITDDIKKQRYVLRGLLSYNDYNISVKACIEERCSNASEPLIGKTKIGRPSRIDKIHFNSLNNTVTWEKPLIAGGEIDFYEIQVTLDSISTVPQKLNASVPVYALQKCGETSPYSKVSYKVRAVNIGEDGTKYHGPWSNEEAQKCQKVIDYSILIYAIIGFLSILVIAIVVGLFGKRCYIYFITMKDVQFQLPEGLSVPTKDRYANQRGNELDFRKQTQGDDQFLLYHKDGIKRSGDSSGCSSGQDSAESDSGTSLGSSTDSGTEQRRTKDEDLAEAVALEDFSRSTSGNNTYCQYGYPNLDSKEMTQFSFSKDMPIIRANESTSSSDISPYIRCDQIPQVVDSRPVNSGYVSNSIPSSGYVPHPVEEKKSGYVPHPSVEKNTGYVMAAEKNSIIPSAENKGYVQVADVGNAQMQNIEGSTRTNGYVSYGDVKSLPTSPELKGSSAYVPHKQLDQVMNK